MQTQGLQPVRDRLVHLDVLRGFALLGILLVNFQFFVGPIQGVVLGADPSLGGASLAVDWLIKALAEGKFYPLFSMLFGAGFALMAERAASREAGFFGVYLRRLIILAMFGLAHLLLVWAGDILLIYSLCAFVMVLLFRKTPARRLWKWAIPFLALPALLLWLGAISIAATQFEPDLNAEIISGLEADAADMRAAVEEAERIQMHGSYRDNLRQRVDDMRFLFTNALFWVPPILGFFLIGRWLVQTRRLLDPVAHREFFERWCRRGLILGLPLALIATSMIYRASLAVPTLSLALGATVGMLGAVFLSMGYLSLITLSAERLRFLAPAGRMALTNYLTQSLVWTWLLYGHGLGLANALPRWSHLLVVVLFFALQVALSHWWLNRFRFGPAEWLWRSLTYWQRQPMRQRPLSGSQRQASTDTAGQ